jgi:tetratricopeptide (TPR) repeat protein
MYKVLAQYEASSPDERSKGYAILQRAGLEYGLKMYDKSLASYMAAAAALPDEPSVWQSIAALAAMKNDTAIQLRAYKELGRLQPDSGEWKKRIEEIENRLNSTMLQ